jgi:hypothetical protein
MMGNLFESGHLKTEEMERESNGSGPGQCQMAGVRFVMSVPFSLLDSHVLHGFLDEHADGVSSHTEH